MSETGVAGAWCEVGVAPPAPGALAAFEAGGLRLVLCHVGGALHAIEDRCPHAFARLSEGRLEGFALECPLHGGKLDVRDGRPLAAPIRKPVRTFALRQTGAALQVALDSAAEPPRP